MGVTASDWTSQLLLWNRNRSGCLEPSFQFCLPEILAHDLSTHTVDRAIFLSTLSAYKAGDPKTCGTAFSTAAKLCDALVIFALLICLLKIPSKYSVSQNKQGLSTLLLLLLLLLSCPLIKSGSKAGMFELEVNQGQAELEQGIPPLESWSLSTKTRVKQRENQ